MGLTVTITDAGRAALRNAAGNGTNAVTIAAVGLSSQAFTPGAAIPAEIKRLTTISGGATAADTIHVTVLDSGDDDYSVYGFALYLSDGTLFASYGQSTVIVEKSAQAMMQLALDVRFVDVAASSISFGDANFMNPAATEDTLGVVKLASADDATSGTDNQKAITPQVLSGLLTPKINNLQSQLNTAVMTILPADDTVNTRINLFAVNDATGLPFVADAKGITRQLATVSWSSNLVGQEATARQSADQNLQNQVNVRIPSNPGTGFQSITNLTLSATGQPIFVGSGGGTTQGITTFSDAQTNQVLQIGYQYKGDYLSINVGGSWVYGATQSWVNNQIAVETKRASGVESGLQTQLNGAAMTLTVADDGTNQRAALVAINKAWNLPFITSAQNVGYHLVRTEPGAGFQAVTNFSLNAAGQPIFVGSGGGTTQGITTFNDAQTNQVLQIGYQYKGDYLSINVGGSWVYGATQNWVTGNFAGQQVDTNTFGVSKIGVSKQVGAGIQMLWTYGTDGVGRWCPISAPGNGFYFATNLTMGADGSLYALSSKDGATNGYAPSSYGTIAGGYYVRIGNILIQAFSAGVLSAGDSIAFPIAFSAAPVVSTTVDNNRDGANRPVAINPTVGTVTASGFKINIAAISGANQPAGTGQVWVFAMGPA
ncbi:hypothetical protein [Frateuria aurantia]|uniref:Uncharacterized protein n=1 Tax=Frateuria aurantia (strain ATCC 33424 / DSM 6220 / KCTC 2777 / LMG 1558 / NBRC 3245 / NCIMB 13370) TaxID=767434 RepID=H8L2K3_FRAAD|nr:hypothetical protein [Frateuria aurantia]AFC85470.1 hypothetical protein Fraau_1006 [Frateuria aurantia DSM 6220]